jgi:hypothetical protein
MACSYDRLGAGASDKPAGPQTFTDSGRVLTAVIDRVAGDAPVVFGGRFVRDSRVSHWPPVGCGFRPARLLSMGVLVVAVVMFRTAWQRFPAYWPWRVVVPASARLLAGGALRARFASADDDGAVADSVPGGHRKVGQGEQVVHRDRRVAGGDDLGGLLG